MHYINTDKVSISLREKAIDLASNGILVTNFQNSEQEKDLTEPANCDGFGRIRHFKFKGDSDWPINPLPILPASKALKLENREMIRAQVFQNAVCNWRCWYCFVDFKLLSGNRKFSSFLDSSTMIDLYLKENNPPSVIDLTGGQPDITPEWVPWIMETLIDRGIDKTTYLWSDDNLSNDYFWRYLSKKQIDLIREYPNYGRVCCFKGIDEKSFHQNTGAEPSYFNYQFDLFQKLLELGIDLYSYITLPAATSTNFKEVIPQFLDRIQNIDEQYPLRIVPLKIKVFTPVMHRIGESEKDLMEGQSIAISIWNEELQKRFSKDKLEKDITDIKTKFQRQ